MWERRESRHRRKPRLRQDAPMYVRLSRPCPALPCAPLLLCSSATRAYMYAHAGGGHHERGGEGGPGLPAPHLPVAHRVLDRHPGAEPYLALSALLSLHFLSVAAPSVPGSLQPLSEPSFTHDLISHVLVCFLFPSLFSRAPTCLTPSAPSPGWPPTPPTTGTACTVPSPSQALSKPSPPHPHSLS